MQLPILDLFVDDNEGNHQHAADADATPEVGDEYIGAQVTLPHGTMNSSGRVVRRIRNDDGTVQGTRNDNPILDTRVYEVVFPDGEVSEYGANVIAENMWAQCDLDGNQQLLMDAIIDNRIDNTAIKPVELLCMSMGAAIPRKRRVESICVYNGKMDPLHGSAWLI